MRCGSKFAVRFCAMLLCGFAAGCGAGSSEVASTPPPPPSEVITISTATNIQCVQTVPFSLTLQAQGNSTPVIWTILSGQLPAGLSLDSSSGTISGTPTAGNFSSVTIQAADAKANASKQFLFTLWGKLTINPVTPTPAHLNAPYSLSISGQGSSAIASWTVSSGQLPPGLSLTVSPFNLDFASVSGTPTQTGTFNFTVQAQDFTLPQTATLNVTIVVDNHLAITKSALKNGGQNQSYLDSFTAVNGTLPLLWSITGNFPAGLSLDSASGKITGTPSNFGGFAYSVSVTDSSTTVQSDSRQGSLTIAQQMQIIGTLPPVYIGDYYSAGYTAIGGYYPYSWQLISGSLPSGMSLTQDGTIVGRPTQLGPASFVLQVKDSGTPPFVLTQPVTLTVVPTLVEIPGVPISPAPVNVVYHSQIPAIGGSPPYTWSISSGQLPPGLFLDTATGFIDGTPAQVGTFNFLAKAADSGVPQQSATANDFIQIGANGGRNDSIATATPLGNSANLSLPLPLSISPYIDPLDAATPNPDTDFYKLVANGGSSVHVETSARRSWGANTLDSVIELLNSSGQRYSTCTQPAYTSSCLNDDIDSTTLDSALDFKVPGPSTAQSTFYLHVFDWRGDARPDMQYFLNISGVVEPLTISPSTLELGATRGVNYQQQFTAKGGTGNVTWSVASGNLPAGWFLSNSGLLSGVATTDGSCSFAIQATDSANPPQTSQTQFTLLIAEPVAITVPVIWPNACLNQPYSFTILTTGGIPPIRFGFYSDRWPAINSNQTTGTFSGTSDVLGTFTGTVGAVDSAQPPSTTGQNVSLTVVNCP